WHSAVTEARTAARRPGYLSPRLARDLRAVNSSQTDLKIGPALNALAGDCQAVGVLSPGVADRCHIARMRIGRGAAERRATACLRDHSPGCWRAGSGCSGPCGAAGGAAAAAERRSGWLGSIAAEQGSSGCPACDSDPFAIRQPPGRGIPRGNAV